MRKVTRDVNEDVRDRVRALANTEAFQQSRRERKKVEMRFAHMKRILSNIRELWIGRLHAKLDRDTHA